MLTNYRECIIIVARKNSISNGEKREAGENPARSRHCDAEQMHVNCHCVFITREGRCVCDEAQSGDLLIRFL